MKRKLAQTGAQSLLALLAIKFAMISLYFRGRLKTRILENVTTAQQSTLDTESMLMYP